MKEKTYKQIDYAAMCEGLTVLVNCLNEILDSTGKRDDLALKNKEKVVQAYLKAKEYMPVKTLVKRLGVSEVRIRQWASDRKCEASILKKCFLIYPSQLTMSEQQSFKRYLFAPENSNLPRNHIWAKAKREGLVISKYSFYKYATRFAGNVRQIEEPKKRSDHQIRAKKPLSILHMDSTLVTCSNQERVFVHFILDNYSRKILGAVTSHSSRSEVVARNLKQVIDRYRLHHRSIELYCDDGPENRGYIHDLLEKDKRIRISRIVGTYNYRRSNNMIERWNHKFKYIILKKFQPESFGHLEALLPEMIEYSNNLHLPILNTLTPNEVLKGKKTKDLNYKRLVQEAVSRRFIENRNINCLRVCPGVNR